MAGIRIAQDMGHTLFATEASSDIGLRKELL